MSQTVSIVIVSRHRPEALRRCLIAISQINYEPFETVIVADPLTCTGLRSVPQAAFAKVLAFDEANIAAARNLGINASGGEIVAFIDDDAVPEPTWLTNLTAPFSHVDTAAAAGYVRGRDGITWEFQASSVDRAGRVAPIGLDKGLATILIPTESRTVRTEGTNMAVRRSVLETLGGFDPRFRYRLEDADLNLRMATLGLCTAVVPTAEVHHGFAPGSRRRNDRAPRDLSEVGASWAVFLGKHCAADQQESAWKRVQAEERERACVFMAAGLLEPRDVSRLMSQLHQGYTVGQGRQAIQTDITPGPTAPFQPNPPHHDFRSVVISGRFWSRARLQNEARHEAATGSIVTLILLSPTALYHQVSFTPGGYWQQTGGVFGRSVRSQPFVSFKTFRRRVRVESDRVGKVRGLS